MIVHAYSTGSELRAKTRRAKVNGTETALTHYYNIYYGALPPTWGYGAALPRHWPWV